MKENPHILIAPNAFKNSLNAESAAAAIRKGLYESNLGCTCECFPVSDGGDGTCDLIIKRHAGSLVAVEVSDPAGRRIRSSFGLIDEGDTAVIEMADASGMKLLKVDELNPLHCSTSGTGEMISHALDKGVKRIIIGMGGSATVDGGTGVLSALGVRFLDAAEKPLSGMPESLINLARIDLSGLDQRILDCELIVLCDVENKLLGQEGAAPVFGPQKGATSGDVKKLVAALTKFAEQTLKQTGIDIAEMKSGGAAGGAPAGLFAFLNAKLVSGIDYFLQLTGFEEALQRSDVVITGEGSIDGQTMQGKAPFGVAREARLYKLPVIALAGMVPLEKQNDLYQYFDVLMAIGHRPADKPAALRLTSENLTRVSREIGNLLALQ